MIVSCERPAKAESSNEEQQKKGKLRKKYKRDVLKSMADSLEQAAQIGDQISHL